MSANRSGPHMSEARRYQQLRSHFSHLKLDSAAEALPRILDAARAEHFSLTAALERLLEIEVNATEERRLASRLRFACLPDPWTLSDFDFAAQPGVDEKFIRDLATLRFLDDASNVLLVGSPGVSKPYSPPLWPAARPRPATGSTSPPQPIWLPAVTRPRGEGCWSICMRFFAGPKLL